MFGRSRRSHGPSTERAGAVDPAARVPDPRTDEPNTVHLLGDPVAHSLSAVFQNAAFRAAGIPWEYVARQVPPAGLFSVLEDLRRSGCAGANVTIPHKMAVLRYLDSVDREAGIVGAVNTIVYREGGLHGSNTDGDGFLDAIGTHLPDGPARPGLLLLGSGGAARAVGWALVRTGRVASCTVVSRNGERGQLLINALRDGQGRTGSGGVRYDLVENPDRVERMQRERIGLIVNATPVGQGKFSDSSPMRSLTGFEPDTFVFDLVYGPGPTPLLQEAERLDLPGADGRRMLLCQGARAFNAWTGLAAPFNEMEAALEEALK